MDALTLRRKVQRKAKIRGLYSIKLEALDEIVSFVSRFQGCEDDAIDLVLDNLHDESCTTMFLFLSYYCYIFSATHLISFHGKFLCFFYCGSEIFNIRQGCGASGYQHYACIWWSGRRKSHYLYQYTCSLHHQRFWYLQVSLWSHQKDLPSVCFSPFYIYLNNCWTIVVWKPSIGQSEHSWLSRYFRPRG